jgi:vacuolar-type H+-ATPase catalytic subunit A/Vma1
LSGGDVFGSVYENDLFNDHSLMIHPESKGRVTYIAPSGNYNINDHVISLEFNEKIYDYTMV